jgi:hypothetical protein
MADRQARRTHPGFADPALPVAVPGGLDITRRGPAGTAPAAAAVPVAAPVAGAQGVAAAPSPAAAERPKARMVEVEVTHERGPAPSADPARHAYELWTQNHIYFLDAKLVCLEVRSRTETRVLHDHPLVGARMVGGQVHGADSVEMSYPLPRPGSLAVFEARKGKRRQYPHTSPVERVVLRLHISTVTGPGDVPTWDEIAGDP